jgi:hypothetical protein
VREGQVAVADLQHPELREVPAHRGLGDLDPLVAEGLHDPLLRAELLLGDQPQMRSCLVVLSTGARVAPIRFLLLGSYLRCSRPRSSA